MDRSKYFLKLFNENGYTAKSMAQILGIKRNTLYKKIGGMINFYESDCKKIITALNMPFEEVFCHE